MGTGVAGALKKRGGVVIEEEAMRLGPVEVGEAVLTTAGNLPATPRDPCGGHGHRPQDGSRHIGKTTQAVLALAVKHKLTSLALPALGTGVGHVPPALVRRDHDRGRRDPPEGGRKQPETRGFRPLSGRRVPCLC